MAVLQIAPKSLPYIPFLQYNDVYNDFRGIPQYRGGFNPAYEIEAI